MKKLDFDSDGEDDKLTINKKFAKKFEFNKNREEFQKLKSKYGSDTDSDSEEEDEHGELATEDINQGISKVLELIKNEPEKLKDKSLQFFPEITDGPVKEKVKKEKSLTLKEYVLTQNNEDEDEQETYVEQQGRHKKELIDEINAHGSGDDNDDDFLTVKDDKREIEPVSLPNPDEDADGFLSAFVSNKGWLDGNAYTEGSSSRRKLEPMDSDDDEEFNEIAEKYESAYNFRFEDPNSVEIMSYARDQNTLRRKQDSARQKQREKKREQREEKEKKHKQEVSRLRKHKIQHVADRLEEIKQVLGENLVTAEDLEGDWDDTEWDKRMQKLFNEEFYQGNDDFKPPGAGDLESLEKEFGAIEGEDEESSEQKKEYQEKQQTELKKDIQKLSKKELKRKAQDFVDANEDLIEEEASENKDATFKYRTVEPESFGLSTEDILLADDRQLNMYVGLKKLASFRDKEKVSKDKKRYGKKKRLREWRKDIWGNEDGPGSEAWENLKKQQAPAKHKSKKHKSKR